jgi:DNA invertase Pin-like site-specific DNA recombinase/transcription elongation GreA/GreB family factor
MEQQRVVALVRVSSEEQAQEGLGGLERQRRDIAAIAARESLLITETFTLEGVSGSTVKLNPQFQRMLKAVSAAGIAGLIVSSPDRLMRCSDLSDLAVLAPFGEEARPRLIWTADTTYNLSRFESQIMFVMHTLIGGHEKKQIIKRTQAGKTISRERPDKSPEKPPKGVEFVVVDQRARTGFFRYTSESAKIKRAFYRVLDRDASIKSIAKELNFSSYQSMRKQLMNPIWTGIRESSMRREKLPPGPGGKLRYRRVPRLVPIRCRIALEGEPLVTQQVFEEVQQILGTINHEHVSKRSGKSKFEVSGLLRCPCGERYYSKHDDRKGKSGYYQCKSGYFAAAKGCGYPILQRATTDALVVDTVVSLLGTPERLTEMLMLATTPVDHAELKEERDRLRHKAETLTRKRTKLIDQVADGLLSDDEVAVSMGKIRSEIEATNGRLAEIERKLKGAQIVDLDQVVGAVVRLFHRLKFQPTEQRRKVLRQVVQEVQIGPDKGISAIRIKVGDGQSVLLPVESTKAA